MQHPSEMERFRDATREAAARAARARTEAAQRAPRSGDLFLFAETAESGVLWALVATDPSARCQLVAADALAFTGSRDVAVPASAACGALRLRCGVIVDLPPAALESAQQAGQLPTESLERLHARLAAVQAGHEVGSELERQTDCELAYREWTEVTLGSAQSTLVRAYPLKEAAPLAVAASPPARSAAGVSFFSRSWRLAAAILVAVSVGLLSIAVAQRRQIAELLGVVEGQRQQIAELEALPPASRIHGNLPFVHLPASGTRSEAELLEVPSTAPWVAVFLQLDGPQQYPEYRLEVLNRRTGRQVGAVDRLTRMGIAEVSVALPRGMLDDGEYRLLLYGRRDGVEKLAGEFALEIRGI